MADLRRQAARELLPHTRSARLLDEVERFGPAFIEATGRVPASHPLAANDRVPSFMGLELGAQAAAALEALLRGAATGDHSPHIGHLVRVRAAAFLRPDLPVDTPLHVNAHLTGAAPPLTVYEIRVSVGGVEFLRATLSTHRGTTPEDGSGGMR